MLRYKGHRDGCPLSVMPTKWQAPWSLRVQAFDIRSAVRLQTLACLLICSSSCVNQEKKCLHSAAFIFVKIVKGLRAELPLTILIKM